MKRTNLAILIFALAFSMVQLQAQTSSGSPAPADITERVSAATVVVLTGEGGGRLTSVSTGVIVKPNGIILTAYHVVKDAHEVQIRLRTGDVYDNVVLLGADERRDVAALKISATQLPVLPSASSTPKPRDSVYVVSSSNQLSWTASTGTFAASRVADDVPGAGQGYRVLQFSAAVAGGASGAPLVDSQGSLLGVITKGMVLNPSTAAFAVPLDSVIALADATGTMRLGNGSALQLPSNRDTPSSAGVASTDPEAALRAAKTVRVASLTMFFTPEALEKELVAQKDFASLGLKLVKDQRVADMVVTIDRPLFTYTFTYTVTDSKTSLVFDTGSVNAIDGKVAAGRIAKKLVPMWLKRRATESAKPADKESAGKAMTK